MFFSKNLYGKSFVVLLFAAVFSGCTLSEVIGTIPVVNQMLPTPDSSFLAGDDETQFIDEQSVKSVEVTYTDFGFQPQHLEVEPNTRVVFLNQTASKMWIISDQAAYSLHPSFNQAEGVKAGEWFSIIFLEEGSWDYKNHLNPDQKGSITVQ